MDLATLRVLYRSEGLAKINSEFTGLKATAQDNFGAISRGAGLAFTAVGAAATGALALSTKSAVDFESAMRNVGTLGVENIGELREGVLDFSSEMGENATESARQLYQIISAGVPESSAIRTLDSFAKASKAGVGELGDAIELGTSIVNAYGESYNNVESILGNFLTAVKLGKTTVGELGSAVGKVAPTAQAAGVSIQELAAAYAGATSVGIKTTEVSSGLKAALANIIKPSETAADVASALGLEFNVAALKAKGLRGFLDDVTEATGGNVDTMSQLFGSVEALNTIMALTSGGGAEKFKTALEQMTDGQKTLNETFEEWAEDNPEFAIKQARAALEEMAIRIGTIVMPVLGDLAQAMKPVLQAFSGFVENHPLMAKALVGMTAGFGLFSLTLGPLLTQLPTLIALTKTLGLGFSALKVGTLATQITTLGSAATAAVPGLTVFTTGMGAATIAAAPLVLAVGAIAAGLVLLGAGFYKVYQAQEQQRESVYRLAAQTRDYALSLEQRGAKIDWVKLKEMDWSEQRAYLAEKDAALDTQGLQHHLQTLGTKAEADKAYTVAKNLMLNQHLSMEEAARLAMMGLRESQLMEVMRANKAETQSLLESLGIRDRANRDAVESKKRTDQEIIASGEEVGDSYSDLANTVDENMKAWIRSNLGLLAKNSSVWNQLSANHQAYAQEYANKVAEMRTATETESASSEDAIEGLGETMAELPNVVARSGNETAANFEAMVERIKKAAAEGRYAIQGLDPNAERSPSPNAMIRKGLIDTVGLFRDQLGHIEVLTKAARAAFSSAMAPNVQVATDLILDQIDSGVFGPPGAIRGTANAPGNGDPASTEQSKPKTFGPEGVSVHIGTMNVEKDVDVESVVQEIATRLSLKIIANGG